MAIEWLRDIRIKNKLTQRDAAAKAGITVQMYNYIENNHRRPSPEVAKRIANVMGFTDDWYRLLDSNPNK